MPSFPVHHQLPEFPQTHVHRVSDAIQPSHPLSSPSPLSFSLAQHQGLFQWISSSNQVAKVLEFQLQHQSFQWTLRTDLLYDRLVGSSCSPRDSQESSPTPQFKTIRSWFFLHERAMERLSNFATVIAGTGRSEIQIQAIWLSNQLSSKHSVSPSDCQVELDNALECVKAIIRSPEI